MFSHCDAYNIVEAENMYIHEEKRRWPRMRSDTLIFYQIPDPSRGYCVNIARNVSNGGISLVTDDGLAPGTKLKLFPETSFKRSLSAYFSGVVVSSDKEETGRYITRIKLLDYDTPPSLH
jgi:hypothetical protein